MKRSVLILLAALILCLSSCSYPLDEAEGAFDHIAEEYLEKENLCEHVLYYDRARAGDAYERYPNSEYHSVQCYGKLLGEKCDFEPKFEKHTKEFLNLQSTNTMAFNGHYYHAAQFICSVCGKSAGTEYVICSNDV